MEIKKENITHSPVEVCLYLSACSLRDTPPAKWEKDSGFGVTFPEKSLVKVPPPPRPTCPLSSLFLLSHCMAIGNQSGSASHNSHSMTSFSP